MAPGTEESLCKCLHLTGFGELIGTQTAGSRWQEQSAKLVLMQGGLTLSRKPQQEGKKTKEKSTYFLLFYALLSLTTRHTKLRASHPPEEPLPSQLPSRLPCATAGRLPRPLRRCPRPTAAWPSSTFRSDTSL